MKTRFENIYIFCFLLVDLFTLTGVDFAAATIGPTRDPNARVVDYECFNNQVLGKYVANCSKICPRSCLYKAPEYIVRDNAYCYDDPLITPLPYHCVKNFVSDLSTGLNDVNFFGLQVDRAVLILGRRAAFFILGIAALLDIAIGGYSTYKLSRSEANPDKVQEVMKIYKGLIIGTVIIVTSAAAIQIAALLSGVTGDLFDFNFLPRSGRVVFLTRDDEGRKCFIEQQSYNGLGSEPLVCDPDKLVWTY